MALLYAVITLGLASFICPLLLLIFKYAMKEKTYDERIAEHRKRLAMEHNGKSKSKHQPSKRTTKKVEKVRIHSEKKNKIISSSISGKETKKIHVSKGSTVYATEKTDAPAIVPRKKLNSKCTNLGQNYKTNVDLENAQYVSEVDGNNEENNSVGSEDDNSNHSDQTACSSNYNSSVDIISNVSTGNIEVHYSNSISRNENDSGIGNEKCFNKNRLSIQNGVVKAEKTDLSTQKMKNIVNEATLTKNANVDDNMAKQFSKSSEKFKEVKIKPKGEDKTKIEDDLSLKDKSPVSPVLKNLPENNTSKSDAPPNFNVAVATNSEEEMKIKSEDEFNMSLPIPEANSEKEDSSPITLKKSNGSLIANSGGGRISLIQGVKNQRQTNNIKGVKNPATEINALQKISNENKGSVNVTLLMPLLAKAELSRSEIQNLIDLLLNKQQEDGTIDAEWIDSGRQDPIAKMKKQLAEKEKALAAEQEAHQAIQNKLKELRAELNIEKHANRQREETLNSRQADMHALNGRLQAAIEEKRNFTKQIQQLQCKMNEECLIVRSLKEENSKTKNNLQQELLSQRQQLEMHISHLNEQHSQAIITLEAQLGQLAARIQEQEAANAQMSEENVLLRDRIAVQDNQIAHYQQTHSATQDLMLQLDELRGVKHNSQFEINRLNNELKSVTEQLNRKNGEMDKYTHIVQNVKIENEELLKENSRINEQINFAYNEKHQLQIENEELKKHLIASDHNEELRKLDEEKTAYRNMLAEKDHKLNQLREHITELEAFRKEYQSQATSLQERENIISELKNKLEQQQAKNNELRSKNWKTMEALSNMEKTLKANMKGISLSSHDIKLMEREAVIQRLKALPNVLDSFESPLSSYEDDAWFEYLDKIFKVLSRGQLVGYHSQSTTLHKDHSTKDNVVVLEEIEKQNKQLQAMVSRYKSIISDTDEVLNSLQKHTEQEENRWSEQVRILTDEVQLMNDKLQTLQSQLKTLAEERDNLLDMITIVQNGCVQNDVSRKEQTSSNCVVKYMILANSPINDNTISS